jgi:uncharacterized protein with ACT and thioredoxin-like domain
MRSLAACLFVLLAAPAVHAEDASGFVRAVYFETARGVLVDAGMLHRPGATRWVDVELTDKRRVLVEVPAKMQAGVGDLVDVQLGEPKSTALASVLTVNRVTEVRPQSQLARNPIRVP